MRRIVKKGKNRVLRKKHLRSKMALLVKKYKPRYQTNFEKVLEAKLKHAKNLIEEEGMVKHLLDN